MNKPMFDSTGSLIEDEGEKILVEDKWIKVKPVKKGSRYSYVSWAW